MSESEESTDQPPDADGPADKTVVAEVAAYDEELAEDVGALLERVTELQADVEAVESELETAEERLERTRADFKNYKERAKRQQEEIKERATEDLVERLLEVRDNVGRALNEEADNVDSLRDGIELTRKQFDRVLAEEDVERIEPEPGNEVDATKHEVMMRVGSEEPEDAIASVYRPGYKMADKILRPAQVTVSDGPEETESTSESLSSEEAAK
ncbi:nucleotide exchange factor GrpE [Halodesulfurarchaeum sp.]|uniref:nucleotide exchange factor GrpE n=1 Tax=Halodesulfurarchaeum sp. TaxID=1980530 RepID=UPI001BB9CEE6|nr:nucleotide exchange factor GrpE [Halodesulfurarchaeum sp.]